MSAAFAGKLYDAVCNRVFAASIGIVQRFTRRISARRSLTTPAVWFSGSAHTGLTARQSAVQGTRLSAAPARLPQASRTNRLVVRSAATLGGKKVNKVVLAYSGGLDTSVILTWLKETYDCEVVTFTADLGQVQPCRLFTCE